MSRFPTRRLRRLRQTAAIRDLLAEIRLSRRDLVAPLFVCPGEQTARPIESMPQHHQLSVDRALDKVSELQQIGLQAFLLFGLPESKDAEGSAAWDDDQPVGRLVRQIKDRWPETLVITDVCLCEYTDHGHCGPICRRPNGSVDVDNDAATERLARVARSHARCGADIVAPSAMMDGQVAAIRAALDADGHTRTGILSYAVKFASSLYGPFRDAAGSAPSCGDRRGYQMDFRAGRQALLEAAADAEEGADMLMVKPAGAYLDILARLRERLSLPLAAYQVSGEYAMLHAAGQRGWLDLPAAAVETVTAIKRAGADLIITYFAETLARHLGQPR
jgi:porphobilinogen synthase